MLWKSMKEVSLLVLMFVIGSRSVDAHQTDLFAVARGRSIEGEVQVHGGGMVKGAVVRFFDPNGESLGQTTTNAKGEFVFACQVRCDHRLVVDDGSGHSASFTIKADALPEDLPSKGNHTMRDNTHTHHSPPSTTPADFETLSRQMVELSKQFEHLRRETRYRDIVGGIGYIVGLAGVAFYFLGSRRNLSKEKPASDA